MNIRLPCDLKIATIDQEKVITHCVQAGVEAENLRQTDAVFSQHFQKILQASSAVQWILYIHIVPHAVLQEPIECLFTDTAESMNTHVVLVADEESSVTFFERFEGTSVTQWLHTSEVIVGPSATVDYVSLCALADTVTVQSSQRSELSKQGSVHWHNTTVGGNKSTYDLQSNLVGRQATSTVDWIFSVRKQEHQSISARNIFSAEDGAGEITLKGVVSDKARATCFGMIEIAEQGKGTNTYLTENVLMLDSTAHIDAVPGLEIRTNDVKASHSATVSRVTMEDLFYLQSRGIDVLTARQMFVEGFLRDLTTKISDSTIRNVVELQLQSLY